MCYFATSMARTVPLGLVLFVVALVGAAGALGGYAVGREGPPPPPATVLSVTAAGSLAGIFPILGQLLANTTPGVSAPAAAEQFAGSVNALSLIVTTPARFDVAASADLRLIPQLLEPTYATWEVVFATSPLVLAYDPSVSVLSGINASNWPTEVTRSGVLLGIANASTDPNGYNAIFSLELAGTVEGGSLGTVYSHFFTSPVGSLAVPDPRTTRVAPETQAAFLLTQHEVSAFFVYRSYAIEHGLSFVDPGSQVDLGSFNGTYLASYSQASTTILTPQGPLLLRGAPIAFAATVPRSAPSSSVGDLFVGLLFSPNATALLSAHGFTPVSPGYADHWVEVPPSLAGLVVPMPAALLAEIPVA